MAVEAPGEALTIIGGQALPLGMECSSMQRLLPSCGDIMDVPPGSQCAGLGGN